MGRVHGAHGAALSRQASDVSFLCGLWAGCTASPRAARSRRPPPWSARVERIVSLDDLDADAIVVATPPDEAARLLGEPDPALEHSPIVSVHLLFDRQLLAHPLAALLDSDAHWIFDRGALTGHDPGEGRQYLTVVSSGVPELMETRGRELVDLIAGQLAERLGPS